VIFLNKISTLEILLFDFNKVCFLILSNKISFSFIVKMVQDFIDEVGIIG